MTSLPPSPSITSLLFRPKIRSLKTPGSPLTPTEEAPEMIESAPFVPTTTFSKETVKPPISTRPSKCSKLTARNPSVVKLNGAAAPCGAGSAALKALSSPWIAGLRTSASVSLICSVSWPVPPSYSVLPVKLRETVIRSFPPWPRTRAMSVRITPEKSSVLPALSPFTSILAKPFAEISSIPLAEPKSPSRPTSVLLDSATTVSVPTAPVSVKLS